MTTKLKPSATLMALAKYIDLVSYMTGHHYIGDVPEDEARGFREEFTNDEWECLTLAKKMAEEAQAADAVEEAKRLGVTMN